MSAAEQLGAVRDEQLHDRHHWKSGSGEADVVRPQDAGRRRRDLWDREPRPAGHMDVGPRRCVSSQARRRRSLLVSVLHCAEYCTFK